MKKRFAIALLALTMATGCGLFKNYKVHPGSPNKFDSQTYDALVIGDAAIKQTKSELANGTFTGNLARNVSLALNGTIQAYDIAQTAYTVYHTAATSVPPTSTAAMETDLRVKLDGLNNSLTNLNNAKGGK